MRFIVAAILLIASLTANASRTFNDNAANYLNNTSALVTSADFSWACWINPDRDDATSTVMALHHDSLTHYFLLYINSSGAIANRVHDGSSGTESNVGSVSTGSWQLVGGVFASSTSRTAYDGGTAGTTDTTSNSGGTVQGTSIGAADVEDSGTWAFDGLIAHCAVWDGVLDGTDFTDLASGDCPTDILDDASDGPLAYWKMDTDTGSTIPDEIASFDLSVGGTVAYSSDNPTVNCGGGTTIPIFLNHMRRHHSSNDITAPIRDRVVA